MLQSSILNCSALLSRGFSFARVKTAKNSRLKLLLMSSLAVFIFFLFFLLSSLLLSFSYSHHSYASFLAVLVMDCLFGSNYSDSGLTFLWAVLLIMFNKAVLSSYSFPYANVITLVQVLSWLSCSDGLSYTFLCYELF